MTSKIDQLFGSKTRVRLLNKILLNDNQKFYLRELSRQLCIPYGMLYKEQKNLAALGIIQQEKKGKITLISANKDLPYFNDLKNLIIKTSGLADLLKQGFSELQKIRYALIYGSIASGKESASSDIDLLVIGEIDEEKILEVSGKIEVQVGREINYILWTNNEFTQRIKSKHGLLSDISQKPMIMIRGIEDEFRRVVAEQCD